MGKKSKPLPQRGYVTKTVMKPKPPPVEEDHPPEAHEQTIAAAPSIPEAPALPVDNPPAEPQLDPSWTHIQQICAKLRIPPPAPPAVCNYTFSLVPPTKAFRGRRRRLSLVHLDCMQMASYTAAPENTVLHVLRP